MTSSPADIPMPSAKLNVFQQLALQWETLHPYNAAQSCLVPGTVPAESWKQAWRETIAASGLGGYRFGRSGVWGAMGGGRFSMSRLTEIDPPIVVESGLLEDHISGQLNEPFTDGQLPLRAMISPRRGGTQVGVVYRHVVADSVAIRLLLQDWIARALGLAPVIGRPVRVALPTYTRLFGGMTAGGESLKTVLDSARWAGQMRRSRRLEPELATDLRCKYSGAVATDISPSKLAAGCRRIGLTVGDYLLAAVADAAATLAPPPACKQRRGMVVGQVVDLRPHIRDARLAAAAQQWFGLFLGFSTCMCEERSLDDFSALLRAAANHRAKSATEMSRMLVRMVAGLWMSQTYSQPRLADFYRRRMPLAAGLSNVNLNQKRSWMRPDISDRIETYERVSPTGPLMPFVVSTTSHRDQVHIGITRRSGLISDTVAEAIRERLIGRLRQVADDESALATTISATQLQRGLVT
jgi:hypothetical protein